MMTVSVYEDWDRLLPIRTAWNELADRSATREIFLTFDYLRCWHRSNTRDATPKILVLSDGSVLAGIAPLMSATRKYGLVRMKSLEFLGTPNNDYSDFIYADPRVLPVLWNEVRRLADTADLVCLQQIKDGSPTAKYLMSLPDIRGRKASLCSSAVLPQAENAPIELFLKAPGLRKRQIRRIEKEGKVALDLYDSPAEVAANLPILFDHHVRRWHDTDTPSVFERAEFKTLYELFADGLPSNILLAVMRLNGTPVASLFGFVYGGKLLVHKIGYNPDYRRFYCGFACIIKVMAALRRRGIGSIDFARGAQQYKTYFADVRNMNYEFYATVSPKGHVFVQGLLMTKELAQRHARLRSLLRRFGYDIECLEPATTGCEGGEDALPKRTSEGYAFGMKGPPEPS